MYLDLLCEYTNVQRLCMYSSTRKVTEYHTSGSWLLLKDNLFTEYSPSCSFLVQNPDSWEIKHVLFYLFAVVGKHACSTLFRVITPLPMTIATVTKIQIKAYLYFTTTQLGIDYLTSSEVGRNWNSQRASNVKGQEWKYTTPKAMTIQIWRIIRKSQSRWLQDNNSHTRILGHLGKNIYSTTAGDIIHTSLN